MSLTMNKSLKIWMNGELIDWNDAKIHILSHVVHYGSSIFEGIRCYETAKGSAILFLDEHIRRLRDSAKIYRIEIPYSEKELKEAVISTIQQTAINPAMYARWSTADRVRLESTPTAHR